MSLDRSFGGDSGIDLSIDNGPGINERGFICAVSQSINRLTFGAG